MTSWCTRHSECLWEASQALRKVQKEYDKTTTTWKPSWEPSDIDRGSHRGSEQGPFRDDGRLDENEEGADGDWWGHQWKAWSEWSTGTWHSKEYDPPESWDVSSDIFIPEFLAGFLLLHRSGLDANERANILAAIRGEFSTKYGRRCFRVEHLDAASREAYFTEEDKVQEALAAIRTQKTTLREARWKQKQLKLGRGYFPPKPFQKTNEASGSTTRGPCFRCGGPHRIAECPKKGTSQQAKVAHEEAAEIAFVAGVHEFEEAGLFGQEHTALTLESVVDSRMGVVDSGATASLAFIDALEKVRMANLQNYGEALMEVDVNKKPVFRFGNGAKSECLSTVTMGLGAGEHRGRFEVHVHEAPGQPVLISKKALKALGAVLDFERSCNFRKHRMVTC